MFSWLSVNIFCPLSNNEHIWNQKVRRSAAAVLHKNSPLEQILESEKVPMHS